jgi:hypothetical protein
MLVPDAANQRWSTDFMSDQLANGRRFRIAGRRENGVGEKQGTETYFTLVYMRKTSLARFFDDVLQGI